MRLDELFGIGEIELLHHFETRYHFKFHVAEIEYQAVFQKDGNTDQSIWSFAFWSETKIKGRPKKDMGINQLAGRKVFIVFTKIVSGIHKFIKQVKPDLIHFMADEHHIGIYNKLGEYLSNDLEELGYYLESNISRSGGFYFIKPTLQRLDEKINLFRDIDLMKDEFGDVHFEFQVNDFSFEGSFWNWNDNDCWEFEFSRKLKNDQGRNTGQTTKIDNATKRSATMVFSYVISALNRFIIDYKPKVVYFTADADHQEIYDLLSTKLKNDIPNQYQYSEKQARGHKVYTLDRVPMAV